MYTFFCCKVSLLMVWSRLCIDAAGTGGFKDYWNQTETFETLRSYVDMNYDGGRLQATWQQDAKAAALEFKC